ncbi:MAG: Regulator of chromosome condensation repeat-containing protein, partial [Gemmatimonadetes bacterium]|nr:Regulator of chromosome condensation repeat-containing protein [Gemmatimonadota bacterium]
MRPLSRQIIVASTSRAAVAAILLSAAACGEIGAPPTAPDREGLRVTTRLECVGSTTARSVSCSQSGSPMVTTSEPNGSMRVPAPMRDVILGNQNGYVKLTSSNVSVAGGVFSFDVTVKNLLVQAIGTTTGSNVAPSGIRVFFASGPVMMSGTGTIDFDNGSGGFYYDNVATFTASNQPYFQYTTRLLRDSTSSPKTWRLRFDPGVLTFAFTLYVSAPVQFPDGYVSGNPNVITVNPGELSSPIGGTVRNAVNNVIGGTITYTSGDPTIASVD